MSAPYIVLRKRFIPKRWRAWYIGRQLTQLTRSKGLVPLDDPRHGPQTFRAWCDEELHAECGWRVYPNGAGGDWHQDGDTTPESRMDNAMVLWANRTPTEFLYKGKVYQPRPFEVILVRNLSCKHRRPGSVPEKRWLFRQRIEVPEHIELP